MPPRRMENTNHCQHMLNVEPVKCTNTKSIQQIIKDSCGTKYHRWCHKEVEKFYDSTEGVTMQQHWKLSDSKKKDAQKGVLCGKKEKFPTKRYIGRLTLQYYYLWQQKDQWDSCLSRNPAAKGNFTMHKPYGMTLQNKLSSKLVCII